MLENFISTQTLAQTSSLASRKPSLEPVCWRNQGFRTGVGHNISSRSRNHSILSKTSNCLYPIITSGRRTEFSPPRDTAFYQIDDPMHEMSWDASWFLRLVLASVIQLPREVSTLVEAEATGKPQGDPRLMIAHTLLHQRRPAPSSLLTVIRRTFRQPDLIITIFVQVFSRS